MELNKQQEKAANFLDGNLLIIASAGTGKTTTIIERYINLIEKGIKQEEIMMTTFTNKAAKDMMEKIRKRTDKVSSYIGTMHSIFLKILRINSDIFEGKRFTLLTDEKDKNKILKTLLSDEELDSDYNAVRYFSGWISKYKNLAIFAEKLSIEGGIDDLKQTGQITEVLDDELILVDPLWRRSVNKIYKKYQEYLEKNNLLDFDEILMKTFKLFSDFPEIKERYKNHFKAIMVDEAQDLNLIQKKILDQISSDNLCFIGDDCQNIYEWRGSSNEIIFDFSEIENKIFLENNYRSSKQIIKAVNKSIKEMKNRIDKKLVPTIGSKNQIGVESYFKFQEEIEEVASKIEDLLEEKEIAEDIAVLFRTNMVGKGFEREMIKRNIPCHISKKLDFFQREEIKDVISLLRFKINRNSLFDLERIFRFMPGFGITSFEKIRNYCQNNNLELKRVLPILENTGISEKVIKDMKKLLSLLEEENIKRLIRSSGYYNHLLKKYRNAPKKYEEKEENLYIFLEMYKKNYDSISEFLDSLHETDKKENHKGKVILSTIHSAKGLEWKHVFLVGCNEGLLPFYKEDLTNIKRDSELRLFYVAISRAKEGLYISSHFSNYFKNYEPSHFLDII